MAILTSYGYSARRGRFGKARREALQGGTAPCNLSIFISSGPNGPRLTLGVQDDDNAKVPRAGRLFRLDLRDSEISRLAYSLLTSDVLAPAMALVRQQADKPAQDAADKHMRSNIHMDFLAALRATLEWASNSELHNPGNPYGKAHVIMAERALAHYEGRPVEGWALPCKD